MQKFHYLLGKYDIAISFWLIDNVERGADHSRRQNSMEKVKREYECLSGRETYISRTANESFPIQENQILALKMCNNTSYWFILYSS